MFPYQFSCYITYSFHFIALEWFFLVYSPLSSALVAGAKVVNRRVWNWRRSAKLAGWNLGCFCVTSLLLLLLPLPEIDASVAASLEEAAAAALALSLSR